MSKKNQQTEKKKKIHTKNKQTKKASTNVCIEDPQEKAALRLPVAGNVKSPLLYPRIWLNT